MDTRAPTFGNPAPWGYFATVAWAVFAFVLSTVAAIVYSYWFFGYDQLRTMIDAGDD